MTRPDYMRHRDRMIAYGRWQPYVPADAAREHVRWLSSCGVGWEQAATLAGLTRSVVSRLLYGTSDRPPSRRIRPESEAAILAVRPTLDVVDARTIVDATGTRRRLQGLAWQGWSMRRLSARLGPGVQLSAILLRDVRVRAATARAVIGLCRELHDKQPPEGTRAERVAAARTRNHAREEMGWVPLAAWDAIDDPAAVPVPGWERGERREPGTLAGEVLELTGFGLDLGEAAERLGVSRSTVGTVMTRERERAAAGERAA